MFKVSVWKSRKGHDPEAGAYEFRVSKSDREKFFSKKQKTILLVLPGIAEAMKIELRPSFWNMCSHFGNDKVKDWLWSNHYAPWPRGKPPQFSMKKTGEMNYQLCKRI